MSATKYDTEKVVNYCCNCAATLSSNMHITVVTVVVHNDIHHEKHSSNIIMAMGLKCMQS